MDSAQALLMLGDMVAVAGFAAFAGCMIAAAVWDVTTFTIPNRLSAALVLLFPAVAMLSGMGLDAFAAHAGTGLVALLAGKAMFAFRLVGGGDAKLAAAALLWLGPAAAPAFLLWTAIAGGLLALALIQFRRMPLAFQGMAWAERLHAPGAGVPYGLAIAAGAIAAHPVLAGIA